MLIDYLYFNPNGNLTALVTSAVPFDLRKNVADQIMQTEPGCEQVGFLTFIKEDAGQIYDADVSEKDDMAGSLNSASVLLEMTGGEFCGNATMCAGIAVFLWWKQAEFVGDSQKLAIKICGSSYEVTVKQLSGKDFECSLKAPGVPEGISHTVIELELNNLSIDGKRTSSAFSDFNIETKPKWISPDGLLNRKKAESEIKAMSGVEARGLMFLDGNKLTPLVYVPKADTLFWENSCASGSMAVGSYLYQKTGQSVDLDLQMPGGIINVKCNSEGITLTEKIRLISETSLWVE